MLRDSTVRSKAHQLCHRHAYHRHSHLCVEGQGVSRATRDRNDAHPTEPWQWCRNRDETDAVRFGCGKKGACVPSSTTKVIRKMEREVVSSRRLTCLAIMTAPPKPQIADTVFGLVDFGHSAWCKYDCTALHKTRHDEFQKSQKSANLPLFLREVLFLLSLCSSIVILWPQSSRYWADTTLRRKETDEIPHRIAGRSFFIFLESQWSRQDCLVVVQPCSVCAAP